MDATTSNAAGYGTSFPRRERAWGRVRPKVSEEDQEPPKAQPVGHPRPVTAQRMLVNDVGQQRLDRCPHCVHHVGLECAHDVGDLPGRLVWIALGMKPSQPSDRGMVTYPRDP